eukprot:366458-Chlamydomonas_euryale.AAC.3
MGWDERAVAVLRHEDIDRCLSPCASRLTNSLLAVYEWTCGWKPLCVRRPRPWAQHALHESCKKTSCASLAGVRVRLDGCMEGW